MVGSGGGGGLGGGCGSAGGGGIGSGGGLGSSSGGGGAGGGDIRNAVLRIAGGSVRHTCITTSFDQTCAVWDVSGAVPTRLSTLKGLPSVSTAGVMGAHLHSSTVHLHEFITSDNSNAAAAAAAAAAGGGGGSSRASYSSPSSPSAPYYRQVIFACAGHKVSVAPLPSLAGGLSAALHRAQQHPGATGVVDTAQVRYFSDRAGHKVQRHHLTTKASVVLPLWRMMLLGGSDDKIRVCL
jgi:hypothetical protein